MDFDRVVKCETPFHRMVMSNRVALLVNALQDLLWQEMDARHPFASASVDYWMYQAPIQGSAWGGRCVSTNASLLLALMVDDPLLSFCETEPQGLSLPTKFKY